MAKETVLNSVEEVIEDFRIGKPVIVVDDEDRENEGDFIVAAEKITQLRSPCAEQTVQTRTLHLQR